MSKSDFLSIEKKVDRELRYYFSGDKPVSLVIGVSGGADSMCLLHILHELNATLSVVHCNYQKRGDAAEKDAALVETVAADLGVDCKIIVVNSDEAEGQNFQQWARDVRYSAFEAKADQLDADGIAVAHHRDDQIETILQKIFRGGGLASWSAMQVWDGRLFRPLLRANREEIEQFCRDKSIAFRDDASNLNANFARNFLRNKWLPDLEQHFPGWQQNVLRVAEQADIFASSLQFILQTLTDEKDRLNRSRFLQLDESLQKSVLLYYLHRVDESAQISRNMLKEIEKLDKLQTGKSIYITPNFELVRDRDHFKLMAKTADDDSFLSLEKEDLEKAGVTFNGIRFRLQPFSDPDFDRLLYMDTASVAWPLHVRRWNAGDRFQPLGMVGHQSVADHLTNRKVSAAHKDQALVLQSFEETICAVIFPPTENRHPPGTISEPAKCGTSTRQCLTIKPIE